MWDEFIELSESLSILFEGHFGAPKTVPFLEHPDHTNLCYESKKLDLGHISIIDKRHTKNPMWMMHVAAYANINYPMPVYGFDVVCGKNKVTGVFHDISPTLELGSSTEKFFKYMTNPLTFQKNRELPPWAKSIFSPHMIAVGNPNKHERKTLTYLGRTMLNEWINELQNSITPSDSEVCIAYSSKLSDYCHGQLENTNSKNVMSALGMEEDYVNTFKKFQFPY